MLLFNIIVIKKLCKLYLDTYIYTTIHCIQVATTRSLTIIYLGITGVSYTRYTCILLNFQFFKTTFHDYIIVIGYGILI